MRAITCLRRAADMTVGPISFEASPARGHVIDWPALWCSAADQGDPFDMWLVPLPAP